MIRPFVFVGASALLVLGAMSAQTAGDPGDAATERADDAPTTVDITVIAVEADGTPIAGAQATVWIGTEWLPTLDWAEITTRFPVAPPEGQTMTNAQGAATVPVSGPIAHVLVRARDFAPAFVQNVAVQAPEQREIRVTMRAGATQIVRVTTAESIMSEGGDDREETGGVPFARVVAVPMVAGIPSPATPAVWLSQPWAQVADGDFAGTVTLHGLAEPDDGVRYRFYVTAAGYSAHYSAIVAPTDDGAPLDVTLQKLATIEGTIKNPDGTPMPEREAVAVYAHPLRAVAAPDPVMAAGTDMLRPVGVVEFFWADSEGRALGPTGVPDSRYARPGSGIVTSAEWRRQHLIVDFATMPSSRVVFEDTPWAERRRDNGLSLDVPPAADAELRLRVVGIPDGYYSLDFVHPKRPAMRLGPFLVAAHDTAHSVDVRMPIGATLTGTVQAPDGAPVANARVTLSDTWATGRPAMPIFRSYLIATSTDDAGRFEFLGLLVPHQTTRITVVHPEFVTIAHSVRTASAGESTNCVVTILRELSLRVRVQRHDGSKPDGAELLVAPSYQSSGQMTSRPTVTFDADAQEFVVDGLKNEWIRLRAFAPGFLETVREVRVDYSTAPVPIYLRDESALTGTIRAVAGNPPTAGRLTLIRRIGGSEMPYAERRLEAPTEAGPLVAMDSFQERVVFAYDASTGEFRFGHLPGGEYRVRLELDTGTTAATMWTTIPFARTATQDLFLRE